MTESLATGTYEVLRNRLREAASDLRVRFEKLNHERAAVFGNIETLLKGTAHVTTDHNCVPRDLLAIGDRLLLGYNVQFGLKSGISCEDVFSLYRLDGEAANALHLDELFNEDFRRDFQELYRYYKHTTFSRFFRNGPFVYLVFQVGKSAADVKAFKWAVAENSLRYVDNRSDQEVRFPEQHAFRWTRANRDQHRAGPHPHISINDAVFVECVGGDLTIKVEDNTEDGSGIYAEPVDNADQTLDDAEIYFCVIGNLILLKMRPYQEKDFRYLVFSTKQQKVARFDAIAHSCVLLPDDHGIVFPGGLVLQTGAHKVFDHGLQNLLYEQTIAAPNGEDYLYVFTDVATGSYLHLRYNVIRQEVDTPLICHGQAFFEDGRMITFRGQEHAQKHHALQLWQTPYVGPNYPAQVATDSMLYKIGNRELVRGMSACQELLQLIDKDDSYAELYLDLVKRSNDILDGYFWINRDETQLLSQPLEKIRESATAAVAEFDKVVRVRRDTQRQLSEAQKASSELIHSIGRLAFNSLDAFVSKLAAIRKARGIAIGLRELRYIDEPAVGELQTQLTEAADRLGHRCLQHLLDEKALAPTRTKIAAAEADLPKVETAAEGRKQQENLEQIGSDLALLIDTVSQLKIEDLTQRTAIVDRTGDALAELNRVRSGLKARIRDLLSGEMEADFASQTKLLDQAAAGALDTADTPEKVDVALTQLMLQLEELEGRFAEFDALLARITEKREAIYEAFETRRQQLVEARSRRADSLATAAQRILDGINSKALRLPDTEALRSYFVADPMVDKVRQIASQLLSLGDSVRTEDLLSKLKSIADDSLRQLRDRHELFSDGEGLIKLGRHRFSVNRQPIELTSVVRDGQLQAHLTGTQFYQTLQDPALEQSQDLWQQFLPSESPSVYRGEFLAAQLYRQFQSERKDARHRSAGDDYLKSTLPKRLEFVRTQMQSRHAEGYSRGVHDHDAEIILTKLLDTERKLGLLRYTPEVRGLAWFIWSRLIDEPVRVRMMRWVHGYRTVAQVLPDAIASSAYVLRLERLLAKYGRCLLKSHGTDVHSSAANYLFQQLLQAQYFMASPRASQILVHLQNHLPAIELQKLRTAIEENSDVPLASWTVALDAVDAYLRCSSSPADNPQDPHANYRLEVTSLLICDDSAATLGPDVQCGELLQGLVGDHPRLSGGVMAFNFHEFLDRLWNYHRHVVPRFEALRRTKHRLLEQLEGQLRTSEFKPKVLTSFVRNKLIDEVYLPLIGDNLAKQIGASGDNKRSDRMGLLLLVSPPGYGKTTLMEYIANRLGLVFVKVNGPALGHSVTSLDPAEATNVSSREEVQRINLALEMGDNVMLYLDDIQHCNPELLQKFIPLCDATRRIEGVWERRPKTYDLRGRKVAVVMAGNPYTESGDRFQLPDMLANRADVYNLGEIIGDSREAFELSYLENCLTSNVHLQPLARSTSQDQRAVVRAAELGSIEGLELEASLSSDQLSDCVAVLSKLLKVRDVMLRVNRAYIRSAAQVDAYRTEPPFKLQGSYRNMNRLAERVVPVMNPTELQTLIVSNYEQDAQTLTRDGESNLLKFKELLGILSPAETQRWDNIKYAFIESVRMQGIDGEDNAAKILRSLAGLRDGLESIRRTMAQAVASDQSNTQTVLIQEGLAHLSASLGSLGSQVSQAIASQSSEASRVAMELPEQKVIVQHAVPRVMTDLVRSQFQLLYDGLRPVLEASATNSNQLEKLKVSIDDCLQQYRDLQKEIENSKS